VPSESHHAYQRDTRQCTCSGASRHHGVLVALFARAEVPAQSRGAKAQQQREQRGQGGIAHTAGYTLLIFGCVQRLGRGLDTRDSIKAMRSSTGTPLHWRGVPPSTGGSPPIPVFATSPHAFTVSVGSSRLVPVQSRRSSCDTLSSQEGRPRSPVQP
jgi:hypothetical protein